MPDPGLGGPGLEQAARIRRFGPNGAEYQEDNARLVARIYDEARFEDTTDNPYIPSLAEQAAVFDGLPDTGLP